MTSLKSADAQSDRPSRRSAAGALDQTTQAELSPVTHDSFACSSTTSLKSAGAQADRPSRRLAADAIHQTELAAGVAYRPSNSGAIADEERVHVHVVAIAKAVTESLKMFHRCVTTCFQEPESVTLDEHDMIPSWDSLPRRREFRTDIVRVDGKKSRLTDQDRSVKQESYARLLKWAAAFALQKSTLDALVLQVPSVRRKRCREGIPSCFHAAGDLTVHEHLVLACRTAGLQNLAADVGKAVGGEKMAKSAHAHMADLLQLTNAEYQAKVHAIPRRWRRHQGLDLEGRTWRGGYGLPGLFEFWLRQQAASLMGSAAASEWEELIQHPEAIASADPPPVSFLLDNDCFIMPSQQYSDTHKMGRGEYPVAGAWWHFTWQCTIAEVRARYPAQGLSSLVVAKSLHESWSLPSLYQYLFKRSQIQIEVHRSNQVLCWLEESLVSFGALDMREMGRRKKRVPKGQQVEDLFDAQSRQSLWLAVLQAREKGGWPPLQSNFEHTETSVGTDQQLPLKLQCEAVPQEKVETLPNGAYRWGQYTTQSGLSFEDGWKELNDRWQRDRAIRIAALSEADNAKRHRKQPPAGFPCTLQQNSRRKFQGQLRMEGNSWHFQEDATGLCVSVPISSDLQGRQAHAWRDNKLCKAMVAEHARQKKQEQARTRRATASANLPQTVSDLGVVGKTPEGKLTYFWSQHEKLGRVEVVVTPRSLRPTLQECASKHKQASARETTPQRALRKMKLKVQRLYAKAAKGERQRIIAKVPEALAPAAAADCLRADEAYAPALRTLREPAMLDIAIVAFEFLASMKLHYCSNCDEEWPVFEAEWPRTGVPWVGEKAGKCETIKGVNGFEASGKERMRCKRCADKTVYKDMYSEENLQHLGPRYPALSTLTFYESLLIARVHPVLSVITLTATGVLCYAGHVCNYYVKTLEWFRGLPSALRNKKWFMIKRRRSIRACAAHSQKKPTTANRERLEAGIAEATKRLPNVYQGSYCDHAELAKYPVDGEKEMFEERVDVTGHVHVTLEVFSHWLSACRGNAQSYQCAALIMRYASDQQGVDLRGAVTGETAWELCCRLLSLPDSSHSLSTSDIAQLVVYWLEDGHVPLQMQQTLYDGMWAELQARGKTLQAEGDEEAMKVRWVKQTIHFELDSLREELARSEGGLPLDLEVDAEMIEAEQPSATLEAGVFFFL